MRWTVRLPLALLVLVGMLRAALGVPWAYAATEPPPATPAAAPLDLPLAQLVTNLDPATKSSDPNHLTAWGGRVFFSANDGVHGEELWVSDGTAAGTRMVVDVMPGAVSGSPHYLLVYRDALFFQSTSGVWRTDGTADGTTKIAPGGTWLHVLNDRLIIESGNRLLALDATGALHPLLPGERGTYSDFEEVDGTLYILDHNKVFRTDGTSAGTALAATHAEPLFEPIAFQGHLFFAFYNELLRLSPAGTIEVVATMPTTTTVIRMPVAVGDQLFFIAYPQPYGPPVELWVSRGSAATTHKVSVAPPARWSNVGSEAVALGDALVFVSEPADSELWISDGTSVRQLKDIIPGPRGSDPRGLSVIDGTLYFTANTPTGGRELWRSDGTAAGTRPVTQLGQNQPLDEPPQVSMVRAGERLFFAHTDPSGGSELWATDSSLAGAHRVADIHRAGSDARPDDITLVGERLFFVARLMGQSLLWTSDGTAAGTALVHDAAGEPIRDAFGLTAAGDRLFFFSPDDRLWVAEGTPPLARPLKDFQRRSQLVALGDRVLFGNNVEPGNYGMWVSDGTTAGTTLLKRIEGFIHGNPTVFSGKVYFFQDHDVPALWSTDGSTAGTQPVKTLPSPMRASTVSGAAAGQPKAETVATKMTVMGDTLFFLAAYDSVLWRSDGTAAGTQLVKEFRHTVLGMTATNTRLFLIASGSVWTSDGTTAGTQLLKENAPASDSYYGPRLVPVGDQVFFVAEDATHGRELWASDGTLAGTRLVHESLPGAAARQIYNLMPFGDVLLYGTQGAAGSGLWRSDGTAAGTQWVQTLRLPYDDIRRVPQAAQRGTQLFFQADDGTTGAELYTIRLRAGVSTQVAAPAQLRATPDGTVDLPLRFLSDGTAQARGARLTLTLAEGVRYISDTSGGTAQRSGSSVSWNMPAAGPLGGGAFSVRLRLPPSPPGTRFPLTLTLSTPGETTPTDNTRALTLQVAHRLFLPVLRR